MENITLNKLYKEFEGFEKLLENEKENYNKILNSENDITQLERLADGNFTEEEAETIGRVQFYSSEMQRITQMALMLDYVGIEFDDLEKFRELPNYEVVMDSLKRPALVLEDNDGILRANVNDKDKWEMYKTDKLNLIKEQVKYLTKSLREDGDI